MPSKTLPPGILLHLLLLLALPAALKPPHDTTATVPPPLRPPPSAAPDVAGRSRRPWPLRSLHGWNAGLTISGIHDSVTGWATLATPAIGYSFNDIFSIDATIPIYFYRLADSRSTHPKPDARLVSHGAPNSVTSSSASTLNSSRASSSTSSPAS